MSSSNKPLFSVVVISKNEAKTLPRLITSLKEFQARGGQIIVLDTGSRDDTMSIATQLGCKVECAGQFTQTIDSITAVEVNNKFIIQGEPDVVEPGFSCFDYAAARNYAASLADCDVVAMPDCDEKYTALDIDKINESIRMGTQQFEYDFVFSHDSEGKPQIQFTHCKFYDRRKLRWEGIIHEVLINTGLGDAKRQYLPPSWIKLEHWQNHETNRTHYLTGLAIDCYRNPGNDRNSHYFARELMWSGRLKSATKEFSRHIEMNRWAAERAQSMIYIGDCLAQKNDSEWALQSYTRAVLTDGNRRAGFLRIANHFYKLGDVQNTRTWATAALQIPLNSYYGNDLREYRGLPHELLYWAFWRLGDKVESERHWMKCYDCEPHNTKYLCDAQFYLSLPKVSIVIPHIDGTRESEYTRLISLINKNANYPEKAIEIITEIDFLDKRQGVAKTFNRGVARATGDLIMFLGDDCEPQPNFLIEAVFQYYKSGSANSLLNWMALDFSALDAGLVALNDGVWNGKLATHWLAGRKLPTALRLLDGKFLCEAYHHVGCDNELTARCKQANRYSYAPHSKIIHNTPKDEVYELAWAADRVSEDRYILARRKIQLGLVEYDDV